MSHKGAVTWAIFRVNISKTSGKYSEIGYVCVTKICEHKKKIPCNTIIFIPQWVITLGNTWLWDHSCDSYPSCRCKEKQELGFDKSPRGPITPRNLSTLLDLMKIAKMFWINSQKYFKILSTVNVQRMIEMWRRKKQFKTDSGCVVRLGRSMYNWRNIVLWPSNQR